MCELRQMEVINEPTCKRIGYVADIELDICSGCIISLIVPVCAKAFGIFGVDKEYIIPFECIRQIGEDIILVSINEEKCYN